MLNYILFTSQSVGDFCILILMGVGLITLIASGGLNKRAETWFLIAWGMCSAFLFAGLFAQHSLFEVSSVKFSAVTYFSLFAPPAWIQFSYFFIERRYPVERRIILGLSLILSSALFVRVLFLQSTGTPQYNFELKSFSVPGLHWPSLMGIAAQYTWAFFVFIRRFFSEKKRELLYFLPVSFLMASISGAMLAAYFMNRPLPFLSEVLTGGAALVVVLVFLGVGIAGREKIEIGFKVEFLFVSILILSVFLLIASDKPSVQSHHDYSHRQALQTQLQAPGRPESGAVYDLFYVSKRNLDGNSETIMSRLPPGIPAMDRNLEKIPGSESFRAVPSGGSMVYIHSLFIDYEGTLYEMGYDYRAYRRLEHLSVLPFMVTLPVVAFIATLLTYLFIFFNLRKPVAQIVEAMSRVNDGAFEARVEPGARDELGRMALSFNTMVESLQTAHMRFYQVLEHAPDGIFIADAQGRYTDINAAGCHMVGYTREELLGKSITDIVPPEEAARLREIAVQLSAGGAIVFDWTLLRKDGSRMPVEVSAKILPGGIWQGFVRDITVRKAYEDYLQDNKTLLEKEKQILSKFFSKDVMDQILSERISSRPGGERRPATVLFFDIRNSTGIAESIEPENFSSFLTEIFTDVMDLVYGNHGSVNKLIGDGLLATFGCPIVTDTPEIDAIRCAIQIRQYLTTFNEVRPDYLKEPVQAGIGIATGPVFAGSVGSVRKIEFTVLGDPVNLASRLESLTKVASRDILIDGPTRHAAGHTVKAQKIQFTQIRGKIREVEIFHPVRLADEG